MKKSALVFAVATLGLTFAAAAYDTDPGYMERNRWYGGHEDYGPGLRPSAGQSPIYYRPTMRYFGNGYTVSYRYVPVYVFESANEGASNFRTEAFHLKTEDAGSWGATSPRLTLKDAHYAGPHVPITSIIRKTSSRPGKKAAKGAPAEALPADAPVITPAEPAPVTTPAPPAVPDAAAPAQPKP